jgi:type IV pilus assembly protein PilW
MNAMKTSAAGKERGFNLIELMIAMAVGLLLILLVANLFVGSRETNRTTDDVSRMQENIRSAYQILTRSVRHAGYHSDPFADPALLFTGGNVELTGAEGSGTAPDTLTVAFQGSGNGAGGTDSSVVDCRGVAFDQGVTVVNMFTIGNGQNGNKALFCTSSLAPGIAVEIVPDVTNMQVLYGEDLGVGINKDWTPDRYVPINSVTTLANVQAVRIALLFTTANPSARLGLDTATYNLNGTVVGPFNDTAIRRVLVWNINLRNRSRY